MNDYCGGSSYAVSSLSGEPEELGTGGAAKASWSTVAV